MQTRDTKLRKILTNQAQKDVNHSLLRDLGAILRRWGSYFAGTGNEEFPQVSELEVTNATSKIKWGKSIRPDVPAEVWKLLSRKDFVIIADLFNKIIGAGTILEVWSRSIAMSVWKCKAGVAGFANYRPVRFLCHTMKTFEMILDGNLRCLVTLKRN